MTKPSKIFKKKLERKFATKQDELTRQPGVMGNGIGGLIPTGLSNFVYVTIADKVLPVFNNRVAPRMGVKVWVGYANEEPTLFQVLSTRSETPAGAESTMPVGYAPSKRYEWNATGGGQDPLHVHLRAFSPLKLGVSATGGMNVSLYKGVVHAGGAYIPIATQDIDLTTHIPAAAGKAALVMISIDDTGTIIETKGAEVDIGDLVQSDAPAIPADTIFVCGCVRVYNGQTVIREGRANTDFYDLRFPGLYSPVIIQQVRTQTGAVNSGSTAIPYDDTIPQNTEGDEYMTLAITPKNTIHQLVIEVVAYASNSAANSIICALFQDTTAGALAAGASYMATADGLIPFKVVHSMAAGTISSTTFKVRIGAASGTTTFNGGGTARKLGGVLISSIIITEFTN